MLATLATTIEVVPQPVILTRNKWKKTGNNRKMNEPGPLSRPAWRPKWPSLNENRKITCHRRVPVVTRHPKLGGSRSRPNRKPRTRRVMPLRIKRKTATSATRVASGAPRYPNHHPRVVVVTTLHGVRNHKCGP